MCPNLTWYFFKSPFLDLHDINRCWGFLKICNSDRNFSECLAYVFSTLYPEWICIYSLIGLEAVSSWLWRFYGQLHMMKCLRVGEWVLIRLRPHKISQIIFVIDRIRYHGTKKLNHASAPRKLQNGFVLCSCFVVFTFDCLFSFNFLFRANSSLYLS